MARERVLNFSGGYATDRPPEQMERSMLLTAQNCYWEDGLQGRGGKVQWSDLSSYDDQRGMIRAYINSSWYTIAALEDSGSIKFYYSTDGSSWTQIGTTTWTTGQNVYFRYLNGKVVAVNGTDDAVVIYYDSSWQIQDLDQHDVRTRGNSDWVAGQYTDSGTVYTDDTTDAQDAGADDFPLAVASTNNDGFYVACNFTFTKVTFENVDAFTGSPVASYQYYDENGAWQNLTLETTPDWGTGGDLTLEFTYPSDWGTWDGSEAFAGKFIIRVRFTTAPNNTPDCDYLAVSHTHYLKQVMGGAVPKLIEVHNSSLWFTEGNNIYFSDPNQVTGWELYQADYFQEGGASIEALATGANVLFIMKAGGIHGLFGNQFESAYKRFISTKSGCAEALAALVVGEFLWFLGTDGLVRRWDGRENVPVSKHIRSDIAGWTTTGACMEAYQGRIWLAFPAESTVLVWDPDTFRADPAGDGVVSFFKMTSLRADRLQWWDDDDAKLYCLDRTAERIVELERDQGYDYATGTPVDMNVKTRRLQRGAPQTSKSWGRLKIDVTASEAWSMDWEADDGSASVTGIQVASGTGGGHYEETFGPIPYTLDGKDLAIRLRNNTANRAKLYALVLDPKERVY